MVAELTILNSNEPGSIIKAPYRLDEPIKLVRSCVANKLSEPQSPKKVLFSINGIRIEDYNKTWAFYRALGNTVTMSVRDEQMTIELTNTNMGPNSETFTMKVKLDDTVADIKLEMQRLQKWNAHLYNKDDNIHISYKGSRMESTMSLDHYGIQDGDNLVFSTSFPTGSKISENNFGFGNNNSSSNSGGLFGNTSSSFGNNSTTGSSFGNSSASGSAFGSFGISSNPSNSGSLFGSSNTSSSNNGSAFGNSSGFGNTSNSSNSGNLFGSSSSFSFGNNSSSGLFGAPASSGFGCAIPQPINFAPRSVAVFGSPPVPQSVGSADTFGSAPKTFADVSREQNIKKVNLAKTAPIGRRLRSGTNVEVRCNCVTYRVIIPQGNGIYDLMSSCLRCVVCGSTTATPVTVGFYDCKYRIHGVKENNERYTSDWKIVPKEDQYQVYDESKGEASWKVLIIESRPIGAVDRCTICLEPLTSDKQTIACGHTYHAKCHSQWHTGCPICNLNQDFEVGVVAED